MSDPKTRWDRPAILAEVARKGLTLTRIAEEAGLYPAACSQGLNGGSYRGAFAVAEAIGVSLRDMLPGMYTRRRKPLTNTHNPECSASQNATSGADSVRAA